jgi:hypothetical protein
MSYVNDDVGDTLRQLKHNLAAAQEREKSLRAHAADAEAEVITPHDLATISFSRTSRASHSPTHLPHEWFTPTGTSCICSAHAPSHPKTCGKPLRICQQQQFSHHPHIV